MLWNRPFPSLVATGIKDGNRCRINILAPHMGPSGLVYLEASISKEINEHRTIDVCLVTIDAWDIEDIALVLNIQIKW